MTAPVRSGTRLRREALFPTEQERWPGRWIDDRGATVYGLFHPATGDVEVVDPEVDHELPGLARWLAHGVLVGYRPGRRAVIRIAGPPRRYVKIVRPSHLAGLTGRYTAFDAARVAANGNGRFPESPVVVRHDEAEGSLVLSELSGAPLATLVSLTAEGAGQLDRRVAPALVALQSADPVAGTVPHHVARPPERWAELLAPVSPTIGEMAMRVASQLPAEPAPPDARVVLLHGDLHGGNVVVGRCRRLGLIDLDSLAAGHPAVDPANLAAHLVLDVLQHSGPVGVGNRRAGHLLAAYRAAGGQATPDVLAAMVARTLHRLACVHAVRAPSEHLAPALFGEAERWSRASDPSRVS